MACISIQTVTRNYGFVIMALKVTVICRCDSFANLMNWFKLLNFEPTKNIISGM